MTENGDLPEKLRAQIDALPIRNGQPLIAVDADEVLVIFVDHLERFISALGYEMRLETYQLEGSIFVRETGEMVPFEGCIDLINRFFASETLNQQPVPGGRETLERLSEHAQIIILTNVPAHGAEARRHNLINLGLDWPLLVNSGGKGPALARLAERAGAPVAMIDDSVSQLRNCARHVPEAILLHFAEAEFIQRLFPTCEHATRQVRTWPEAGEALRELLGLPG